MATQVRTEGPTPSGGAYAVTYFFGPGREPADESEATGAEAVEYTADGSVLARTYLGRGEGGDGADEP